MGQYLQMGICHRLVVDKDSVCKLNLSVNQLVEEVGKRMLSLAEPLWYVSDGGLQSELAKIEGILAELKHSKSNLLHNLLPSNFPYFIYKNGKI